MLIASKFDLMKIRQDYVGLLPLNTKGLFRLSLLLPFYLFFGVRFSALPIVKRLDIGVGLGHKMFFLKLHQCVSDIWNIMCAYDECACFIEVHAFSGEVQDLSSEVFLFEV